MSRRSRRVPGRLLSALLIVLAATVVIGVAGSVFVDRRYHDRIVALRSAPVTPVAIVFGAGLIAKGEPSQVLAARLDTGVALYRSGRVGTLLLTGDNSDHRHNETDAMRSYVLERGVPARAVVIDDAGLSTYDSCLRAKEIFGIRRALLVTQRYHLPRALFIANSLGIDAMGVPADQRSSSPASPREWVARFASLFLVISHPDAKIMGPPHPLEGTEP